MLGNMFNYDGPMLWTGYLYHDSEVSSDTLVKVVNQVLEELKTQPIDEATLQLAKIKMRSNLYDSIDDYFGFGLADLLASFALFDDNPARINEIEKEFEKVTPELIMKTAQEYLRATNQTILIIEPQANS